MFFHSVFQCSSCLSHINTITVFVWNAINHPLSCEDCDSIYVGQTGRTLEHRVKEHKRALCLLDDNISAVAEHSIKNEHKINWENAKVVAKKNLTHQRCFLESWFIRSQKAIMNRDDGALPRVS